MDKEKCSACKTMEYHSTLEKNEIFPSRKTWMNPDDVLSKISPRRIDGVILCDSTYMMYQNL
jgi:hypothetical protein